MRFIEFSSAKTETCIMGGCALLVVIFGLWDPRITGSRRDNKKQLMFAVTLIQFAESIWGASSAGRSSTLQSNETDLRNNAKNDLRLQQSMGGSRHETNIWFETNRELT